MSVVTFAHEVIIGMNHERCVAEYVRFFVHHKFIAVFLRLVVEVERCDEYIMVSRIYKRCEHYDFLQMEDSEVETRNRTEDIRLDAIKKLCKLAA